MSRVLAKTVVSGGRIYPAGATVPDEVAEKIVADVWEPDPEPEVEAAPESDEQEDVPVEAEAAKAPARRTKAKGA